MITNLLMDPGRDGDGADDAMTGQVEAGIMKEIGSAVYGIKKWGDLGVIVSNEVGMGLVPDNPMGRLFRDIAGRVNQYIASEADRVYLMVSGIPVRVK